MYPCVSSTLVSAPALISALQLGNRLLHPDRFAIVSGERASGQKQAFGGQGRAAGHRCTEQRATLHLLGIALD